MAKIKFSAIAVTSILGKAGGTVFSKNKGGAYFKNFVMPSNPQSAAQVAVRNAFGLISQLWRLLTDEQRSGWKSQAANFPYNDVFGDTKYLSGFGLHQQLNLNLTNSGQPTISDAPIPQSVYGVVFFAANSLSVGDEEFVLTSEFADAQPFAGAIVVEATGPIPDGVSNVNGKYRSIFKNPFVATAVGSSPDFGLLYAAYIAEFGIPTVGQKSYVRVKAVSTNGEITTYFEAPMNVIV